MRSTRCQLPWERRAYWLACVLSWVRTYARLSVHPNGAFLVRFTAPSCRNQLNPKRVVDIPNQGRRGSQWRDRENAGLGPLEWKVRCLSTARVDAKKHRRLVFTSACVTFEQLTCEAVPKNTPRADPGGTMADSKRFVCRAISNCAFWAATVLWMGSGTQAFANDDDRPDARTATRMTEQSAGEDEEAAEDMRARSTSKANEQAKESATMQEQETEVRAKEAKESAEGEEVAEPALASEDEGEADIEKQATGSMAEPQETATEAREEEAIFAPPAAMPKIDESETRLLGPDVEESLSDIVVP